MVQTTALKWLCTAKRFNYTCIHVSTDAEHAIQHFRDVMSAVGIAAASASALASSERIVGSLSSSDEIITEQFSLTFHCNKTAGKVRRALKKPVFVHTSAIEIGSRHCNNNGNGNGNGNYRHLNHPSQGGEHHTDVPFRLPAVVGTTPTRNWWGEYFQLHPKLPTSITLSPDTAISDKVVASSKHESECENKHISVKEIVLPCGLKMERHRASDAESLQNQLLQRGYFTKDHMNYRLPLHPTNPANLLRTSYRLVPSNCTTIVFKVGNIEEIKEKLQSRNIKYEDIGSYGATDDEQIQLLMPFQSNLFLRFTEHDVIKTFYNEGTHAVLEGTIPEIQSSRVLGGDATVRETKYGFAGDCWVEVRALASRMVNPFTKK